jgi:hypothetical protein
MHDVHHEERREFQRLRLELPLPALLEDIPVFIFDIGVLGARLRHEAPIDLPSAELRFPWEGGEVRMRCERIRTGRLKSQSIAKISYESGVRFVAALGDSGDRLREMLAHLVRAEFGRRKSATQQLTKPSIDPDRVIHAKHAGYLSYRLENGAWRKRRVLLPEQPPVGFTVSSREAPDEMQRLCTVFEASDEEGRRLIRMLAELSISEALDIPPADG